MGSDLDLDVGASGIDVVGVGEDGACLPRREVRRVAFALQS